MANGLFDYNIVQPQAQQNTTMTPSSMPQMSQGITGMPSAMQMGNLQQGILSQAAQPPTRERGSRILGFLADAFKNPNFVDSLIIGTAGMSTRPNTALQQQVQNRMNTRQQQAALQQEKEQESQMIYNTILQRTGNQSLAASGRDNPDYGRGIINNLAENDTQVQNARYQSEYDNLINTLEAKLNNNTITGPEQQLLNYAQSSGPSAVFGTADSRNYVMEIMTGQQMENQETVDLLMGLYGYSEPVARSLAGTPSIGEFLAETLPDRMQQTASIQMTGEQLKNRFPNFTGYVVPDSIYNIEYGIANNEIVSVSSEGSQTSQRLIEKGRESKNRLIENLPNNFANTIEMYDDYDVGQDPTLLDEFYDIAINNATTSQERLQRQSHIDAYGDITLPSYIQNQYLLTGDASVLMPEYEVQTSIDDDTGFTTIVRASGWGTDFDEIKYIPPNEQWIAQKTAGMSQEALNTFATEGISRFNEQFADIVLNEATSLVTVIDDMTAILNSGDVNTGYLTGPALSWANRLLETGNATEYDLLQTGIIRLTLEFADALAGTLSDRENNWLEQNAPSLDKTVEANLAILAQMRKIVENKLRLSNEFFVGLDSIAAGESTPYNFYSEFMKDFNTSVIDENTAATRANQLFQ